MRNKIKSCLICTEPLLEIASHPDICRHLFHYKCLRNYVDNRLEKKESIICPEKSCQKFFGRIANFSNGEKTEKIDFSKNQLIIYQNVLLTQDESHCCICFSKYNIPVAMPDSCSHSFCYDCLGKWCTVKHECPMDRVPIKMLLISDFPGGHVWGREEPPALEPDMNGEGDNDELINTTCEVCNSGQDEHQLLLCDSCNRGYHIYCLREPLGEIPEGDWFCEQCQQATAAADVTVEVEEEVEEEEEEEESERYNGGPMWRMRGVIDSIEERFVNIVERRRNTTSGPRRSRPVTRAVRNERRVIESDDDNRDSSIISEEEEEDDVVVPVTRNRRRVGTRGARRHLVEEQVGEEVNEEEEEEEDVVVPVTRNRRVNGRVGTRGARRQLVEEQADEEEEVVVPVTRNRRRVETRGARRQLAEEQVEEEEEGVILRRNNQQSILNGRRRRRGILEESESDYEPIAVDAPSTRQLRGSSNRRRGSSGRRMLRKRQQGSLSSNIESEVETTRKSSRSRKRRKMTGGDCSTSNNDSSRMASDDDEKECRTTTTTAVSTEDDEEEGEGVEEEYKEDSSDDDENDDAINSSPIIKRLRVRKNSGAELKKLMAEDEGEDDDDDESFVLPKQAVKRPRKIIEDETEEELSAKKKRFVIFSDSSNDDGEELVEERGRHVSTSSSLSTIPFRINNNINTIKAIPERKKGEIETRVEDVYSNSSQTSANTDSDYDPDLSNTDWQPPAKTVSSTNNRPRRKQQTKPRTPKRRSTRLRKSKDLENHDDDTVPRPIINRSANNSGSILSEINDIHNHSSQSQSSSKEKIILTIKHNRKGNSSSKCHLPLPPPSSSSLIDESPSTSTSSRRRRHHHNNHNNNHNNDDDDDDNEDNEGGIVKDITEYVSKVLHSYRDELAINTQEYISLTRRISDKVVKKNSSTPSKEKVNSFIFRYMSFYLTKKR